MYSLVNIINFLIQPYIANFEQNHPIEGDITQINAKHLFMTYCLWICLTNLSPATIQLGQASPTRVLGNKFGCSILLKDGRLAEDLANFPWDNHALHKQKFIRLEDVNTHRSCSMPSTAIMAKLAGGNS